MSDLETKENQTTEQQEQQQEKIKNIVNVSDIGPCKKKLDIEIPESKIRETLDKKYQDLKKSAILPGFRRGRAPLRLLEKRFGVDIANQTKLELIVQAVDEAIEELKLQVLGEPHVEHEKLQLPTSGPFRFEAEVVVRPQFDLPSLEGIPVKKPKIEITDQDVEKHLKEIQSNYGVWTPKETAAQLDDQVIADVKITIQSTDDQPPQVDKRDNVEIYIRKTGFVAGVPVEDLDQVLTGVVHGDVRQADVQVPDTFFNEQYRGKKIHLDIEVKEVKYLKPAELDQELLSRFHVQTVEELKDKIYQRLVKNAEIEAKDKMATQILRYLMEKIDFELPENIVASQSLDILRRQYTQMLMRGKSREEIEKEMDQLRAASDQQAKNQLKQFFIIEKVAETLGVDVTDEEINGQIAYIAAMRGRRPEKMRQELINDGSLDQFIIQVKENKAIEKILEKAQIIEE